MNEIDFSFQNYFFQLIANSLLSLNVGTINKFIVFHRRLLCVNINHTLWYGRCNRTLRQEGINITVRTVECNRALTLHTACITHYVLARDMYK